MLDLVIIVNKILYLEVYHNLVKFIHYMYDYNDAKKVPLNTILNYISTSLTF